MPQRKLSGKKNGWRALRKMGNHWPSANIKISKTSSKVLYKSKNTKNHI